VESPHGQPQTARLQLTTTNWRLQPWNTYFFPLVLVIKPQHRRQTEHRSQEYFYCCVFIRWCRNVFTMPLPRKGSLFSLHYYSFQSSCHIAPSLRLLVSSSLQGRACACEVVSHDSLPCKPSHSRSPIVFSCLQVSDL
jgi:hypothetical protein